jgi:hypothetical protein
MHNIPRRPPENNYSTKNLNRIRTTTEPIDDKHGSLLLSIPDEVLIHVTSFLDPADLSSLGKCSSTLSEHVKDDNTWRRAFESQYLGHSRLPVAFATMTLRRTELTWKREYIARHKAHRYTEDLFSI